MEIMAETKEGFLVKATNREIKEILSSVTGETPDRINIGQKIPAIDYASSIRKVKDLSDSNEFISLFNRLAEFNKAAEKLKEAVENAASIEV